MARRLLFLDSMKLIAPALVLVLASGACSLVKPIEKPTAAVQGVAVESVSLSGVDGALAVEISNPNGFGVPLSSVDWELAVGSTRAVSGTIELSDTIPARASTTVRVALRIAARKAIGVARAIGTGERSYRVSGVLHFSTRIGPIDVAFSGEGELGDIADGLVGVAPQRRPTSRPPVARAPQGPRGSRHRAATWRLEG